MLFKKQKSTVDVKVFRKACVVIDSCTTYTQLKRAMNYVDLYYKMYKDSKTYMHLQNLVSQKMVDVKLF
jgi:hypothetical protein